MISHKLCLIGASAVGKTSLIRQFVDGIFSDKYLTSIGVKIDKKEVDANDAKVRFMVWDIEGTDKFSGFNPRYLNGASAYIIVLDQARSSSVYDALALYEKAKLVSPALPFLAINKSDLPTQISATQMDLLSSIGFEQIIQTSAKTGENVEQLFTNIALSLAKDKK